MKYLFLLTELGWVVRISSPNQLQLFLTADKTDKALSHINKYGNVAIRNNEIVNVVDTYTYVYSDMPKFPSFSSSDIKIRTFQDLDRRDGYSYHYYAYLGNKCILHDGLKYKWSTYDEAYNFALKCVAKGGEQ